MPALMTAKSAKNIVNVYSNNMTDDTSSLYWTYGNVVDPSWNTYLKPYGVKLPKWGAGKNISAATLSLLTIAMRRDEYIQSDQASDILRQWYDVKTIQQLRHLGKQAGFNILQSDGLNEKYGLNLPDGYYFLQDLQSKHPIFEPGRNGRARVHQHEPCRYCHTKMGLDRPAEFGGGHITVVKDYHGYPGRDWDADKHVILCNLCNRDTKDLFYWIGDTPYRLPGK